MKKIFTIIAATIVGALLGLIPNDHSADAQAVGAWNGVPTVGSTVPEACHVMKTGPGLLYSVAGAAGGTALFMFIVDTASAPSNGTVVALIPPPSMAINATTFLDFASTPIRFGTGLTVCGSTTGLNAYASSATGMYSAQVQ